MPKDAQNKEGLFFYYNEWRIGLWVLFGFHFCVLQLLPINSHFHNGISMFALAHLRRSINKTQIGNHASHGSVMVIGSACLLVFLAKYTLTFVISLSLMSLLLLYLKTLGNGCS
jgi:hypothetical protein